MEDPGVSPSLVLECINPGLDIGETLWVTVTGESMLPVLQRGDRVCLRRVNQYRSGDILAYYCPVNETFIVHRFLGYVGFGGSRSLLLKPDAGDSTDVLVDRRWVIGRIEDWNRKPVFFVSTGTRLKSRVSWFYHCLRIGLRKLC